MRDRNGNGDALNIGESGIVADPTNASGISFAFPTGAAFDSNGALYIVNAGNTFGNDGIYRLVDLNGNGNFQDPDEITVYVGAPVFGPGNGPYSPQEIFFDAGNVGYLRNSSANLHGVYRFVDTNTNGHADDPGEFTPYFTSANASGITLSAGFAIEPDRVRQRAMYMLQIASGGNDQLIRLTDVNDDRDAQDAGEAVVVFQTAESGFSAIDVVSLTNGDVLITDNSGVRVIRLHDADQDGLFTDPGERSDFFLNAPTGGRAGDVRQMTPYLPALPCSGDVNNDGLADANDVTFFASAVLNPTLLTLGNLSAADTNCDGTLDGLDVASFVSMIIH